MIHHIGALVRQGEMTISKSNRFQGWLQLFGQEELIRFELDSQEPSAFAGCRFSFKPDSTYNPKMNEIPAVLSIQNGKLIALRIDKVDPPMIPWNDGVKVDGEYQCDFQLVWETQDDIIDIAINQAYLKMDCGNKASPEQVDELPEETVHSPLLHSISERIEQIDKAYGNDQGEFLISIKMPTESQLNDLVIPHHQTMVHKVEEGPKDRMIDFMKEISEQNNNILISDLLEPPIQTPAPENMSDEQLQDKVVEILGRLSILGIEFKRCEHFDNKLLYDWLINKVIPREKVHPKLQQYQMTRFFDTSLWCDHCGIYQDL